MSVVVPVFNERDGILNFSAALQAELDALDIDYDVVFVDDGRLSRRNVFDRPYGADCASLPSENWPATQAGKDADKTCLDSSGS